MSKKNNALKKIVSNRIGLNKNPLRYPSDLTLLEQGLESLNKMDMESYDSIVSEFNKKALTLIN